MKNFIGRTLIVTGLILFTAGIIAAPSENGTKLREVGEQEVAVNNSIPYGINWQKFLGGIILTAGVLVWAVRPNRDYSLQE